MTPKQQRFVEEYLVDLNAAAAARRAGYSPVRADQCGSKNLRRPAVAAAIAAAMEERAARTEVTVDGVIAGLRKLRADAEAAGDFRSAVRALELLGKHVGAFEVHNRQKNPLGNFDPGQFFSDIFRTREDFEGSVQSAMSKLLGRVQ